MAGFITVRSYAELNDFVDAGSRGRVVRLPCQSHQTVKDVLEAVGIPHTEIDLILVNGDPVGFEAWTMPNLTYKTCKAQAIQSLTPIKGSEGSHRRSRHLRHATAIRRR